MKNNSINKIVIVGGGTAGWMTAAALSKTLGCQNYSIVLVESEQIGTVGVGEATVPPISLYNNLLGINENQFIKETNATFKLGIEFVNWGKLGHTYFHPFGFYGVDMDGVGFMHYWMRWKRDGGALDYTKFNVETLAAQARKFTRTANEPSNSNMPPVNYAYHFDASLYAKFLRRYSEARGVIRIEGKVTNVTQDPDSGFIQSLQMDAGNTIQGDLFIDCSGFSGVLIEKTLRTGYQDWSHWLPMNSAVAVPCENADELLPFTRSTAQEFGWQWRIPLQHRIGNGYVYSDHFLSAEKASDALLSRLDGKALADPKPLKFVTGMRERCWNKNCVAIGLASGFLEPLESTSIHLIQVSIAKLLVMFPRDHFNEIAINRYNQDMKAEYDNVKDILIAHYKITEREDTELWRYVKHMPIPDSLNDRLELFKTRGDPMVRPTELFKEASWYAVLLGQGMQIENYHPMADTISDDELKLRLTKIRSGVQNRLNTLPSHADFIRANCKSETSKL